MAHAKVALRALGPDGTVVGNMTKPNAELNCLIGWF